MGEFEYIDWIRNRTSNRDGVEIGPGDDCAALRVQPDRSLLITCDVIMDGRHFQLTEDGPRQVGRKAMAVNLSDIAAMAGTPIGAVVGVALPVGGGVSLREELYLGLRDRADAFDCPLVGGDTNAWDGPLVISVTVFGQASPRGAVTRSGARPGDWLFVTGPLGGSILGHHLDFMPRVREARQLDEFAPLHAMIDLSDGLAGDLGHLCRESGCGAVVMGDRVPITDAARSLARDDGRSPLDHALRDGEDFELLFAVEPEVGRRLLRDQPIKGVQLVHIGECVDQGIWIEQEHERSPLTGRGFEHDLG